MQFFFWLAFLVAIGITIFAVQNSTAPAVTIKFLSWEFGTSLMSTLMLSLGLGMLIILLLWIPTAIRASLRAKKLRKEIEVLKREIKHQIEGRKPGEG